MPSLEKYCQKENDRKNGTVLDKPREERKDKRNGREKANDISFRTGRENVRGMHICCRTDRMSHKLCMKRPPDWHRLEELKDSFESGAAGERQTTRVSSGRVEVNPANAVVAWGVHGWKWGQGELGKC